MNRISGLSCLLIDEDAMSENGSFGKESMYIHQPGKAVRMEILEVLKAFHAEGRPYGNQCICSRYI